MIQKTLVFSLLLLSILQCTKEKETDVCTQLKVTDIKVTYADEKSIDLNWSSTSVAQSFNVKVIDGSNVVFEKRISENTIKIEGLRANKSFKVSVTPYCGQNLASSFDKQITVSTNSGCTAPAPKNFKFNIEKGILNIEWDFIESVAEYEVSLVDKKSRKPIPILDPQNLNTNLIKSEAINVKSNLEPLIIRGNNTSLIIPSGIKDAELIIRPICKIDNFRIDGKNVLIQEINTESAFSSELINIGDRLIECSTFDSLSKRLGGYVIPWNFGYNTNPLSNKGKVGQILYLQILYINRGQSDLYRINIPLYVEKKEGKTTFYNNIENCKCCTQTLNKLESADVFTFEKYGLDTAFNLLVYPTGININGKGRYGNVFYSTD